MTTVYAKVSAAQLAEFLSSGFLGVEKKSNGQTDIVFETLQFYENWPKLEPETLGLRVDRSGPFVSIDSLLEIRAYDEESLIDVKTELQSYGDLPFFGAYSHAESAPSDQGVKQPDLGLIEPETGRKESNPDHPPVDLYKSINLVACALLSCPRPSEQEIVRKFDFDAADGGVRSLVEIICSAVPDQNNEGLNYEFSLTLVRLFFGTVVARNSPVSLKAEWLLSHMEVRAKDLEPEIQRKTHLFVNKAQQVLNGFVELDSARDTPASSISRAVFLAIQCSDFVKYDSFKRTNRVSPPVDFVCKVLISLRLSRADLIAYVGELNPDYLSRWFAAAGRLVNESAITFDQHLLAGSSDDGRKAAVVFDGAELYRFKLPISKSIEKIRGILSHSGYETELNDLGGISLLRSLATDQILPIHIFDLGPSKIAIDSGSIQFKSIERSPKKLRMVSNIAHDYGVAVQYDESVGLGLRKTQKLSTMDDPEILDHINDIEQCFGRLHSELGLTVEA